MHKICMKKTGGDHPVPFIFSLYIIRPQDCFIHETTITEADQGKNHVRSYKHNGYGVVNVHEANVVDGYGLALFQKMEHGMA